MAKKRAKNTSATPKKNVRSRAAVKSKPVVEIPAKEAHPWRACPYGEHQVRTHPMQVRPSQSHPDGLVIPRRWHCAKNPSGKDELYPAEIQEIARKHFLRLKKGPCPLDLKYENGNAFDPLITGWVRYWNEALNPEVPLTPNLVKALIASESRFEPEMMANKKNSNSARGLMQIINDTRKILGDGNGELKDHFLNVTKDDLNSPTINICAGVRWLFYKRKFLSNRLGRPATWEEAVAEYKGLNDRKRVTEAQKKKLWNRFLNLLERLEKCERN